MFNKDMVNKNKTKGIIFDWGGVCCKEGEPFASQDLQNILNLTPNQIQEKVKEIYNNYYIGVYNSEEFWTKIINFFELEKNDKINTENLKNAYLNSYYIYQEIFDLILKLKSVYKIGLLSNLTPEMRDHIKTSHDLEKYFDIQVYSCDNDLKAMKPDIKPYELILKKMNLKADECIFIDNSLKNIETAKKMKMDTIFFESLDKFFEDIKNIL